MTRISQNSVAIVISCLLAFVANGLCNADDGDKAPAAVRKTVTIDGSERSYHVWLPTKLNQDETYWLIIVVSSPETIERYRPLLKQADLRAIVAMPSLQKPHGLFPSLGEGDAVVKMIEDLRIRYCRRTACLA